MWIFIDKKIIGKKLQKVEVYGNLKLLVEDNELHLNNKFEPMNHWQARVFLKNVKNYYEDENIFIKKITVKKGKRKS